MRILPAPPVAAGREPALGHLPQLMAAPLPFLRSLRAQGDVVTIYFGDEPMHVVTAPALAADVLVGRYGALNRDRFAAANEPFTGRSTAVLSGAPHRGRRQLMAPHLRRDRIGGHVEAMARIARARTGHWRDGDVVALPDEAFGLSLATAGVCLLGTDLAQETIDDVHTHLVAALGEVTAGVADRDRGATAELRRIVTGIVAARRADGTDRGDLLSAFLLDAGAALTEEQAVDEVIGLLPAGVDTPSVALQWALLELSRHPEAERRLCAEIDATVGDGGIVTADHVRALGYLHQVVQETLRRYASYLMPSQAERDMHLPDAHIPAGDAIGISLYALHYDDGSFPEPDRFDPDRWSPARAAEVRRGTHLPFSAGRRKCPGEDFALTELTVQLATILGRVHLTPASPDPVREAILGVTIRPGSLPMRVTTRTPGTVPEKSRRNA